jgi:hypothetical protein
MRGAALSVRLLDPGLVHMQTMRIPPRKPTVSTCEYPTQMPGFVAAGVLMGPGYRQGAFGIPAFAAA